MRAPAVFLEPALAIDVAAAPTGDRIALVETLRGEPRSDFGRSAL